MLCNFRDDTKTPDRPDGPSGDRITDDFEQKTVQGIPDSAFGASKDNKRDTVWISQPAQEIPESVFDASGINSAIPFELVSLFGRSRIAPVALPG